MQPSLQYREQKRTRWERGGRRDACWVLRHLLLGLLLHCTLFIFLRKPGFGERDSDGLFRIRYIRPLLGTGVQRALLELVQFVLDAFPLCFLRCARFQFWHRSPTESSEMSKTRDVPTVVYRIKYVFAVHPISDRSSTSSSR